MLLVSVLDPTMKISFYQNPLLRGSLKISDTAYTMANAQKGIDYKDIEDGHQLLKTHPAGVVIPCDATDRSVLYKMIKDEITLQHVELQKAFQDLKTELKSEVASHNDTLVAVVEGYQAHDVMMRMLTAEFKAIQLKLEAASTIQLVTATEKLLSKK